MKTYSLLIVFFFTLNFIYSQSIYQNVAQSSGVEDAGRSYGVAIGDFNNDYLDDFYVIRRSGKNLLYKNLGDGTFEELGSTAGVDYEGKAGMAIWGDINNDSWLDLFVGNYEEPALLYLNNGDGTFSDIALDAGINTSTRVKAALFGDVDNDGFIDLYLSNINQENMLFKNNGDLTFEDFTIESGALDTQVSMGSIFFDYDKDGDIDLYLTHDANQPYILYQNDGDGHFTDVSAQSGTDYAGQGMGVDVGDINKDGWMDIYITNLSYNTLLLNNGDGTFSDISSEAGVTDQGMGWGTAFLDFNNDGLQDIYMVNDSYFAPLPNILYQNIGNNEFVIVSSDSPINSMNAGYGTACTDFNDDGKVDIFVANNGLNDKNELFENVTETNNNWVKIKLLGTQSNRAAIGARVEIILEPGVLLIDEICAGSGYSGQNSMTLHFGLGDMEIIENLFVHWPSGSKELFGGLSVNKTYVIEENLSLTTPTASTINLPSFEMQLSPNPVADKLHIQLKTEETSNSKLEILDVNGQTIYTLFEGLLPPGQADFIWDGSHFPSGIYYGRWLIGKEIIMEKILLLKK